MREFTIEKNRSKIVLHIDGFGPWSLPDDAKDRLLVIGELPCHEDFCTIEFCDAVNEAIDLEFFPS